MANSKDTTIKTFEFKLRTNKSFVEASERELEHSRQIYNAALAERISCYRITGASLSYAEQSRHLTEARALPEVKSHLRTIQQDALERLDEAFKGFFQRLQGGEKPGFPRFKGQDRYHTFSQKYEKVRACPIKGDKITVPGVGSCRVRLSRPIEGQCKQLRITRRVDGWYALLVCEMSKPEALSPTGQTVGVDVGITAFATLSNGEEVENPRHLKNALDGLQSQQRRLSRKKKGSKRRAKQRIKVAKAHLKVARCRKDFHHKISTDLVRRFDAIRVEDLNIRGMVRNRHLAQAISDVAWGRFFKITKSKAENAGRKFERVDPRYTSQICSGCGQKQKMPLALRIYECGKCGIVIGRDHNAAITIDRAGQAQITRPVEKRGSVSMKRERVGRTQLEPQRGGN
ncbi:MAG TPA: transposase [Blastocatellia bacterium]|nr:transposase [Blastocatellia bacterium]